VTSAFVADYPHHPGEHCASTALRNLLAHEGTHFSEGMVFGLASGLGFLYVRLDGASPTRMFHGRTTTLESDFGLNTGIPLVDRVEESDDVAWSELRASIDRGEPVMVSTDTFYLPYHNTTSHFPGHRCVVVGYDDDSETVSIADRKFEEYQQTSYADLRSARNAPDYPMTSGNQYGVREGKLTLAKPMSEAVVAAIARNAETMLDPDAELPCGIPAMRDLAREFADWSALDDWSWAARFGYQVVVKRGAGGSFFRSLYADFLRESVEHAPELASALPAADMDEIARSWRELAAVLKDQSERDACDPKLFEEAGRRTALLADAEESFFERAREFSARRDAR
jgi:hypothetical protein